MRIGANTSFRSLFTAAVPVNHFAQLDPDVSDQTRDMRRAHDSVGDFGHQRILQAHDVAQQDRNQRNIDKLAAGELTARHTEQQQERRFQQQWRGVRIGAVATSRKTDQQCAAHRSRQERQ